MTNLEAIEEAMRLMSALGVTQKQRIQVVDSPQFTRNLFGPIEEIAGKELELIERNDDGDCLCLFTGKAGTNIVDVDHRDVKTCPHPSPCDTLPPVNIDIDTFQKPITLEELTAWLERFMNTPKVMIPMRNEEGKVTMCDQGKLFFIHPAKIKGALADPVLRSRIVYPVPPEEIFD